MSGPGSDCLLSVGLSFTKSTCSPVYAILSTLVFINNKGDILVHLSPKCLRLYIIPQLAPN